MPQIHPMAVVENGAELADDVVVGPFAYIGANVQLGAGCVVHHHASIEGHTTAGKGNQFFPYCNYGAAPQDLKYRGSKCRLVIGDDNELREHTTAHIGTEDGGGYTRIGSNNLIMVNAHIAHDCDVGSHCVIANNVMLAGHCLIEDWVVLSGGVAVTHFATVGEHAFVGGISGVLHDLPPFMMCDGHPAIPRGVNRTGLRRRGFTEDRLSALKIAYKMLFSDHTPLTTQAAELEKLYPSNPDITRLLTFVRASYQGKHGRYREVLRGKMTWDEEDDTNGK